MRRTLRTAYLLALCVGLGGCITPPTPEIQGPPKSDQPRKIVIFFDGTYNDPRSGTNVVELFKATQSTQGVGSFYIEGVGAKGKPVGMAMAWGISMRVRSAYAYLLDHYRPGDHIYLFGFSRGAYSARILASMLYHAGLPELRTGAASSSEIADLIYDAFKGDKKSADRIRRVQQALTERDLPPMRQVNVTFMGLWDTVEALGWPDYEENVDVPNPRYGDQLCNVERAAHAVSLDDNRARIFTPLLLTRVHLLSDCGRDAGPPPSIDEIKQRIESKVQEVFFAGAHADVGGGYEDGVGGLSGVSLNWMVRRAKDAGLSLALEGESPFAENHLAPANDAEARFPFNLFYKRMYRSIDVYADSDRATTPYLNFHATLKDRIEKQERGKSEYGGEDDVAQAALDAAGSQGRFKTCFPSEGRMRRYAGSDACRIRIVDN